jgi:hypothetical protein
LRAKDKGDLKERFTGLGADGEKQEENEKKPGEKGVKLRAGSKDK